MKVDFNHYLGNQIGDLEINNLQIEQDLKIISMLKPEFNQDGDMYCFTYPSREGLPNDCVQGFGETVILAARDFNSNFINQKAK